VRAEFAAALEELAAEDERVVLLTGDLGFTVLERFAERFPDRFFNVGVAEQNMLGLATGLADAGFVPFAYSIGTFASMRGYEFLRNGAVLHELPVRLVGVGGGFDYGHNGVTHYALEDVGLMRLQPDMTVVCPADPGQAVAALRATHDLPGPVFFRLGRDAQPLPGLGDRFRLEGIELVRTGGDTLLLGLGGAARQALDAAEALAAEGVEAAVGVVAAVHPPPADELAALLEDVPLVVTVEGHYATGGLGSLVAEVLAERGPGARLVRHGVHRMPRGDTGTQAFLNELHGLSAAAVAETVREAIVGAPR
jgi:transketolase